MRIGNARRAFQVMLFRTRVQFPPPPPAFAKASAGKPETWRRLSAVALAKAD